MSRGQRELVIASTNGGKIAEIVEVLALEGVKTLGLRALGYGERIEENGDTFADNALIKAQRVFERFQRPVVAEDSGLSVSALGGRPGVRSARFAREGASDAENNRLLLELLETVPDGNRKGYFFCAAVFYRAPGDYTVAEGRLDGFILRDARGSGGFGYDPLFFVPSLGATLAEVPRHEKNRISHRARAFAALRPHILSYFAGER